MVAAIPISLCLAFGAFYPLFFFTQYRDPVMGRFRARQLSLACLAAFLGGAGLWVLASPLDLLGATLVWWALLALVTTLAWRWKGIPEWSVVPPACAGAAVLCWFHLRHISRDPLTLVASLLGGAILAGAVFCASLGRRYFLVRAMSRRHLQRATRFLALLVALRLIWDLVWTLGARVPHEIFTISLARFMVSPGGYFLGGAVLFGTLVPLLLILSVLRALSARATDLAVALLYTMTLSVLLSELVYRHYQLVLGVML